MKKNIMGTPEIYYITLWTYIDPELHRSENTVQLPFFVVFSSLLINRYTKVRLLIYIVI